MAQGRRGRDPRRALRADRRRGDGDLAAPAAAEQRRARARSSSTGAGGQRRVDARRHRRRRRRRGARRDEPGRAARARAQPVPAARDAGREPVPLRRDRRSGAVDGPGPGRRPRRACSRRAAQTRQVVVFTHDDRLPEAVRRLGIDGRRSSRSTRREGSVVELRRALDSRRAPHRGRARARCRTDDLPDAAARRVVPGLLPPRARGGVHRGGAPAPARARRGARRRRADCSRGDASSTTSRRARALRRRGPGRRRARPGSTTSSARQVADAFQAARKGAHDGHDGNLPDLVRDSATARTRARGAAVTRAPRCSAWAAICSSATISRLGGARQRAAALLARQALEGAIAEVLERRAPGASRASARAQLLCLPTYAPTEPAHDARYLWWRSRARATTTPTSSRRRRRSSRAGSPRPSA